MKKRKINKILFLLLIIFIILFITISIRLKFSFLQDDILFLKFLGNIYTSEQNLKESEEKNDIKNTPKEEVTPQYVFDITYKDTNFTNINLIDTIKSKTLVDEKIAPGIKGEFDIIIKTNKDTKYQIYFISQNEKPKNLEFKIDKTEITTNRLEDLKEYLHGNLKKGETKTITIKWNWNYENELEGNIQDTKDAKNIDKYVFDIYTYGEQEI